MGIEFALQSVNAPSLYAQGCVLSSPGPTTLSLSTGRVRDSTNSFDIVVNQPLSVTFTTPELAANNWYALYLASSKLQAAQPRLSAVFEGMSSTDNTPPPYEVFSEKGITYDMNRFVGWYFVDGTQQIRPFRMVPTGGNSRTVYWDLPSVDLSVNNTVFAFNQGNLGASIPPSALEVNLKMDVLNPSIVENGYITYLSTEPPTLPDYFMCVNALPTLPDPIEFRILVGRDVSGNLGFGTIVSAAASNLELKVLSCHYLI